MAEGKRTQKKEGERKGAETRGEPLVKNGDLNKASVRPLTNAAAAFVENAAVTACGKEVKCNLRGLLTVVVPLCTVV